jgi:hypothetical protein
MEKGKVNKFLYNCGELVACYTNQYKTNEKLVIGWIEGRENNKNSGENYYFVVWSDRPLWSPQKVVEETITKLKLPLNDLKGDML